jgi:hypothetical protein
MLVNLVALQHSWGVVIGTGARCIFVPIDGARCLFGRFLKWREVSYSARCKLLQLALSGDPAVLPMVCLNKDSFPNFATSRRCSPSVFRGDQSGKLGAKASAPGQDEEHCAATLHP